MAGPRRWSPRMVAMALGCVVRLAGHEHDVGKLEADIRLAAVRGMVFRGSGFIVATSASAALRHRCWPATARSGCGLRWTR